MLENVIEYCYHMLLKDNYNIKKYDNYYDTKDKWDIKQYIAKNNLTIDTNYLGITIYQQEKKIAVVEFVFGNLISKVNNRRIPKKYTIKYL